MSAKIKILTVIYIFIVAVIIFFANTNGTKEVTRFFGDFPYFDKISHFLLMGFFSFLVNLTLRVRTVYVWKVKYLLGTLIVLAVVTIEELSQVLISERTFDLGDLVADYLGIFLFGELARFFYRKYLVK